MSAPLRIKPPPGTGAVTAGGPPDPLKDYLDRLVKMIPAGVVGLYLVGNGVIPGDGLIAHLLWVGVCLIAVVTVQIYGTADRAARVSPEWPKVVISSIAFLIWVYTLGQPWLIEAGHYVAFAGPLALLVWTFFVPIFYK